MALTLAEASKLSNDMLLQGVVETIVKDSPILQRLPFIEIVGNGLTYNQEKTLPSIDFYDVGDTWAESTPTFEQITANLKIMGGDADVDNFLKATRSNVQDLETATTGGTCSTIYAIQFGEGALCGLTSLGFLQVEPIGSLENKDASRTRVKWYVSLALFSSIKAAALIGVQD